MARVKIKFKGTPVTKSNLRAKIHARNKAREEMRERAKQRTPDEKRIFRPKFA